MHIPISIRSLFSLPGCRRLAAKDPPSSRGGNRTSSGNGSRPIEKFAAISDRRLDGIASYCHPENKVSLGLVEELNNKIRVFQR